MANITQKKQGGKGAKGTLGDTSGVGANTSNSFKDSLLNNLGNSVSSYSTGAKALIDSEAAKTGNRLKGVKSAPDTISEQNPMTKSSSGVKSLTDVPIIRDAVNFAKPIAEGAKKLFTTTPRSQTEIDAKNRVTPVAKPVDPNIPTAPRITPSTKPALQQPTTTNGNEVRFIDSNGQYQTTSADLPKQTNSNPKLNHSYSSDGVSVSSPTLGITDEQKSYLDKTLEYNRRPEVIAGFARNAALSQARYDEYNKSKSGNSTEALQRRLDEEISKRYPNRDVLKSLGDRLQLASQTNNTSVADPEKAARLQFDVNKNQQGQDKFFIQSLIKGKEDGSRFSPDEIHSIANHTGIETSLDDILSYSNLDEDSKKAISSAKDPYSLIQALQASGISKDVAIKLAASRNFQ